MRNEIYNSAVKELQTLAEKTARKCFPDLYDDGLLEQELDTIWDDCEYAAARNLLDEYGDELEDAEDIWCLVQDDLENDVIDAVFAGAENVREWLDKFKAEQR